MTKTEGAEAGNEAAARQLQPLNQGTYVAFLSYSHSDEAVAAWLHRELERYRIPKALQRRLGTSQRKSAYLGRIFRDRADLAASHDLAGEIREALEQSEALIVLCSPRAAASRYVNEEIRLFKSLGRKERIFPIIVEGEPNSSRLTGRDAQQECFPDALVFQLDEFGAVSGRLEPEEPIAADFREGKDGRQNVLLKVVAGLLGIDLDELVQREKAAQRKRQRQAYAIASAMSALAVAALGAAIYALLVAETAERRRVEVVSSQARELILQGDRIRARRLVESQDLARRLPYSGVGRWVEAQFGLAVWTTEATGISALVDCQSRDVAIQSKDLITELHWSAGGITRFRPRQAIIDCQAHDDGATLIDAMGNAYLLKAGQPEFQFLAADAMLPYSITHRANGDLLLDSQVDGLFELRSGAAAFTRLGTPADTLLRRYKIIGGPDPDLFFSIRHNGMGHYFSPGLSKSDDLITNLDAKIEAQGFADCEAGLSGTIIACVLQDGSAAILDWEGNLSPVFVEDGGRLRSITRLDLSAERFAAVNHRGEIILVDPLAQKATAHVRLATGEMPVAIRPFGPHQWLAVTDSGRICVLIIDQSSCSFTERASLSSPIAAIAVDSSRRRIWMRTSDDAVLRADLGRHRLVPAGSSRTATVDKTVGAAPAARLKTILPAIQRVGPLPLSAHGPFLEGFTLSGPPSILHISDDLRWRIERAHDGALHIVHDNATYVPQLSGEFVEARQSLTGFWILSTRGVTFVTLPADEEGSVRAAGFGLGEVTRMRASTLTDNILVDTSSAMIAVRPNIAHVLPERLELSSSAYLSDLDSQRGLLLVANADCSLGLYDVSYPTVLLAIEAPCTDTTTPTIEPGSVRLEPGAAGLEFPLPKPWASQ